MRASGRYSDTSRATPPDSVTQAIAVAFICRAATTAALAMALAEVAKSSVAASKRDLKRAESSISSMMRAIVRTARSGYFPDGRLAREHERVGAVEHRVGHVARPRRASAAGW